MQVEDRLRAGAMLTSANVDGGLEILTERQGKLLGIEQGLCEVNRIDRGRGRGRDSAEECKWEVSSWK